VSQHVWPNAALCNNVRRFHSSVAQSEDLSADAYGIGHLMSLAGLQSRVTSFKDVDTGVKCD
jgi:hypothetical protein